MKIGIVTLEGNYNYGNRLQNYAVQVIFEHMGCEAWTLDYSGRSLVSSARLLAWNLLRPKSVTNPASQMTPERREAFCRFGKLIHRRTVTAPLSRLRNEYDLFAVGSDQVWNPYYVNDYRWSFLEFARPEQRLSMAPSIGISQVSSPYARLKMAHGLRGFPTISVREENAARLVGKLCNRKAEVVIDPTLMITAEAWRSIATPAAPLTDKPYILTYLLGTPSSEQRAHVDELAERLGAGIVRLSDKSREGEVDAGPCEFLNLIDRAAWVVTDSYHASLFSLQFHTPLTIFRREGSANLFARLEGLANQFDIWRCIFGSKSFDANAAQTWQSFDERIAWERQHFADFLKEGAPALDTGHIEQGVGGILR